MPATYEKIATTTLGSGAANITFSSIPATYTDLRVVCVATGSGNFGARLNGDTGTNYSHTDLIGSGSTASSYRAGSQSYMVIDNALNGLGSTPQLYTLDIFSYAGSTKKTTLVTANEDNNGSGYVSYQVYLWNSTAAINSVTVLGSSTLNAGTTATLYGILKA